MNPFLVPYSCFTTLSKIWGSVQGFNSVKSYQSYAAQLDLVITGSDIDWRALMEYLHLNWQRRIIVIEAKNLENRVDDKQFARLCGILEHMFSDTAALGVFFSRYGASGFPNSDERSNRARVLRDAQATQVIFHARTNKFVIVLDHEDILQLSKPGALPKILEAKIRNVEEWTGLPSDSVDSEFCVVDLPSHLRRYMTS